MGPVACLWAGRAGSGRPLLRPGWRTPGGRHQPHTRALWGSLCSTGSDSCSSTARLPSGHLRGHRIPSGSQSTSPWSSLTAALGMARVGDKEKQVPLMESHGKYSRHSQGHRLSLWGCSGGSTQTGLWGHLTEGSGPRFGLLGRQCVDPENT